MNSTTLTRPATLSDWQAMSQHIYYAKNGALYSDTDLIMRLFEETALVMELVRKDRREELKRQIPRVFMWWLAVANRKGVNLHEALWNKYPGICPYCTRERSCICGTEHPEIPQKEDLLRRMRRDRKDREPHTLSDHQKLHARLYGWQNERIFPIQVAAHLTEEVGEVSIEYRHNNRGQFEQEMADVGSWLFALSTRLKYDIAAIVWESFPYECELCKTDICKCTNFL